MKTPQKITKASQSSEVKSRNNTANTPNDSGFVTGIILATFTAFIVSLAAHQWTIQVIADGTIYENSRWGRLPAAYETISQSEGDSIVFIGSSRFYTGIDGNCMEERSPTSTNYWNLAVRGDLAYLRLPETQLLSESGARIVVIEAGPNSFSSGIGTPEHRLRWQVFSMSYDIDSNASWFDLVLEQDRKYLLDDRMEKLDFVRSGLGGSSEEFAFRVVNLGEKSYSSQDGMLPRPDSAEWLNSLKNPPSDTPRVMGEDDFSDYIQDLVMGDFWQPSSDNHPNRLAIDYISSELDNSGIEVVFLSAPVHPEFLNSIPNSHWDEFNDSRDEISQNFHFIDWTWENWGAEDFSDPHHFSELGKKRLCKDLASEINYLLGG